MREVGNMLLDAYQINGPDLTKIRETGPELFSFFSNVPAKTDENNRKYLFNNIGSDENIIYGTLSQEYIDNTLVTVDVESKEEKPIDVNPWERTIFLFDLINGNIYIEKKRYSQIHLDHNKAVRRVEEIIHTIYLNNFGTSVSFYPLRVDSTSEYVKKLFSSSKINFIKMVELNGKKIKLGTILHNPRIDLDNSWAESWNEYDSEEVEEISIKAKKDGNLTRSIMARAAVEVGGLVKEINYYDDIEERNITIKHHGKAELSVNKIKKMSELSTKFNESVQKIRRSAEVISQFKFWKD